MLAIIFVRRISVLLAIIALSTAQDPNRVKGDIPDVRIEVLRRSEKECLRQAKSSDLLVVHYDGYFENSTKFDSRYA